MVDVGVALHRKQLRRPHPARRADPRQIVSHQIHDHQILRPVLGRARQGGGRRGVFVRIGAARGRTLDRPGLHPAVRAQTHEAFGTVGHHRAVSVQAQIGGKRRRAGLRQRPGERGGGVGARDRAAKGLGEIDLEHVAGAHIGDGALRRVQIARPRPRRVEPARPGCERARRAGGRFGQARRGGRLAARGQGAPVVIEHQRRAVPVHRHGRPGRDSAAERRQALERAAEIIA